MAGLQVMGQTGEESFSGGDFSLKFRILSTKGYELSANYGKF